MTNFIKRIESPVIATCFFVAVIGLVIMIAVESTNIIVATAGIIVVCAILVAIIETIV